MARSKAKGAAPAAPQEQSGEDYWRMFETMYRFIDAFEALKEVRVVEEDRYSFEDFIEYGEKVSKAFGRYLDHEARTLDLAFGIKRPKGYHQAKARDRRLLQRQVVRDCAMLYHAGVAIDEVMFKVVGSVQGIASSRVREYWNDRPRKATLPSRRGTPLPQEFEEHRSSLNWLKEKAVGNSRKS